MPFGLKMPNLLNIFQLLRSWKIDEDIPSDLMRTSTPIIAVLPAEIIEPPEKKAILGFDNKSSHVCPQGKKTKRQNEEKVKLVKLNGTSQSEINTSLLEIKNEKNVKDTAKLTTEVEGRTIIKTKDSLWTWITNSFRTLTSAFGSQSELQNMLPSDVEKGNDKPPDAGGGEAVCSIASSPYRILRAAESGNLEMFQRLYIQDPTRLALRDPRGRTTAHQAASRNKINILTFITQQGGDLNAQDNAGNTPLHVAVEYEALDAVDYLLAVGVKNNILNEKKQAPVHLATELSKISVLETMAKHKDKIDIQQGGEHGRTSLHIAAIYDHDACAKILISEFGACPRKPCNNGYYPIHEAAKNASSKTMEVFLAWSESLGCTRDEMISFYDAEGNVPLHSAVHGGDIRAVELCIRSGAKISTQQHDLSTPVHLACAQDAANIACRSWLPDKSKDWYNQAYKSLIKWCTRAIEIVKIMFQMQPEEKVACLSSCDVQKMTPLHCAAMFDHPEIVEYLISEGADCNPIDKERRSPLLLAALRGGWKTVHTLIRMGADIKIKDINKRNVLHLVVINGGQLDQFAAEVSKAKSKESLLQLLNEKDMTGCSPLHYASREGHIRSLENLIKLGACINLKNNNNESPLHFAARYGRYNTVKQLLDSEKGNFIINESDGEGMTPLHISSQQGHTRVVQLLLNRGALLHRDHNGRNPLHLAAMNGFTQTIELLLSVHSHLLDQLDKDGNTALHLATMENQPNAIAQLLSMKCKILYNQMDMSAIDYAIYYKYLEAALAMVTHDERAEEIMVMKSSKYPCVSLALIAAMPRVFEAVQDKCIIKANCKKDSKLFSIKYNFNCLQCPRLLEELDETTGEKMALSKPPPLPALNAMVAHGRVELLAHPLSQKYLQMKWNSYGKYFHLTNLLFYCIFLGSITCFSSQLMEHERTLNLSHVNPSNMSMEEKYTKRKSEILDVRVNYTMYICAMTILIFIVANSAREFAQVLQQKIMYFFNPINLVTWGLYGATILMVLPIFGGAIYEIQFSFASLAVFLSWFNLLLLLQRFDQVGIYVVMFLEILQTLIKVLMVFSILIIAFGLAFYILLSREEEGYDLTRHENSDIDDSDKDLNYMPEDEDYNSSDSDKAYYTESNRKRRKVFEAKRDLFNSFEIKISNTINTQIESKQEIERFVSENCTEDIIYTEQIPIIGNFNMVEELDVTEITLHNNNQKPVQIDGEKEAYTLEDENEDMLLTDTRNEIEKCQQNAAISIPQKDQHVEHANDLSYITEIKEINTKMKRARTDEEMKCRNKTKHPLINVQYECKTRKCDIKFSTEERECVYNQFWDMTKQEQRIWLAPKVTEVKAKRKVEGTKRNFTRQYYFNKEGEKIEVCQKYFLNTLGYKSSSVIEYLLKACKDDHGTKILVPRKDERGHHPPSNKIQSTPIKDHINSFNPKPSHYRRSHAPNRKYLPPDLTIKFMHEDFQQNNHTTLSYEKYRQVVDKLNIGFYDLEADKCGYCIEKDMNPTEENLKMKEEHLKQGDHLSFKTIPMSLIRTFSMMLGEIDFLGTYVKPYYLSNKDENTFLPFPIPAFLILGLFMVLMPILLMNLLIGLAVGDIESVRRNAQLKRLAMQVVLHTELERKLPQRWLVKIDKQEIVEYPNEAKCKKGLLHFILKKWFGSPFSDDSDIVMENSEDYVVTELEKTKKKLRNITQALETQNQFLRLIVQKMEIKTEAEDVDEGVSLKTTTSGYSSKWTSPKIRKKLKSVLSFSQKSSGN